MKEEIFKRRNKAQFEEVGKSDFIEDPGVIIFVGELARLTWGSGFDRHSFEVLKLEVSTYSIVIKRLTKTSSK